MLNPIKKARLIQGLSQEELAKKLGVTTGAVSQWECSRTMPNVKKLKLLADTLHTTVEKLLEEPEAG